MAKLWGGRFSKNTNELVDCGFQTFENCEEEIRRQNLIFAKRINELLTANTPSGDWATILFNSLTDSDDKFVYYNYEAMYSSQEIKTDSDD